MGIRDRAGLSEAEAKSLATELDPLRTLSDVIVWGRRQPALSVSPEVISDVVAQDEFTHDAIVPWKGRALVFGST